MPKDARKERIEEELRKALRPTHLIVTNESFMQLDDTEENKQKREARYSIIIAAEKFKTSSRSQAQRTINQILKYEFMTGLESLSIQIL